MTHYTCTRGDCWFPDVNQEQTLLSLYKICILHLSKLLRYSSTCKTYIHLEIKCNFCEAQYEEIYQLFSKLPSKMLWDLEDVFFSSWQLNSWENDSLKTSTIFKIFVQKGKLYLVKIK